MVADDDKDVIVAAAGELQGTENVDGHNFEASAYGERCSTAAGKGMLRCLWRSLAGALLGGWAVGGGGLSSSECVRHTWTSASSSGPLVGLSRRGAGAACRTQVAQTVPQKAHPPVRAVGHMIDCSAQGSAPRFGRGGTGRVREAGVQNLTGEKLVQDESPLREVWRKACPRQTLDMLLVGAWAVDDLHPNFCRRKTHRSRRLHWELLWRTYSKSAWSVRMQTSMVSM
ncbi:hypothetical protein Emag_006564 [Eimeria magna]